MRPPPDAQTMPIDPISRLASTIAPVEDAPAEGGCACGAVRFRFERAPMFVHCCHCTRCQRETGGPFAHHAMIEFSAMSLLRGEPEFVKVPTDSGNTHWVARCAICRTAMWNEHGSRKAVTRYVRVGTLDEPNRFPPLAHIFVRSKQPWLSLPPGASVHSAYYDASSVWPTESLVRYDAAKALKKAGTGSSHRAPRTKRA